MPKLYAIIDRKTGEILAFGSHLAVYNTRKRALEIAKEHQGVKVVPVSLEINLRTHKAR